MAARAKQYKDVIELMERGVSDSVFPGAVCLAGSSKDIFFHRAFGSRGSVPDKEPPPEPMTVDTVFDVASLTNIVATTTGIMKLLESQMLRLEDRVARFVQGFGVHGKSSITVEHLLSHTSGLAAWAPYFEELLRQNAGSRMGILTSRGAREFICNSIHRSHLKHEPGTKQLYSDLGFILLGEIIGTLTGATLDKAVQKIVCKPLDLKSTSYIDLSMIRRRGIHPVTEMIAPTEACSWRKRTLCGEVHDDNAWAMGGVAGHSGLFITAHDLYLFAREMILAYQGQSDFVSQDTVRRFWRSELFSESAGWRLGWEIPSKENALIESKIGSGAVGHCGFTGCSLWIEPDQDVIIILMSNRIHPNRSNRRIRTFRPELHDLALGPTAELSRSGSTGTTGRALESN